MLGRIAQGFMNRKYLLSVTLKGYTYIVLNIHSDVNKGFLYRNLIYTCEIIQAFGDFLAM
jgi:hypothetical protein